VEARRRRVARSAHRHTVPDVSEFIHHLYYIKRGRVSVRACVRTFVRPSRWAWPVAVANDVIMRTGAASAVCERRRRETS